MSEQTMCEQLTKDIFNECRDLNIRYCDCVMIAKKLIELGWEKKGDNLDERQYSSTVDR